MVTTVRPDVVPCKSHISAVDIVSGDPDSDPIHCSAAEWAEFCARIKAGEYDDIEGHGLRVVHSDDDVLPPRE